MEKEIKKPVKILFVCLGNICRSPAAEGVFKHMLRQRGITGRFEVDSAGTYRVTPGNYPTLACVHTLPGADICWNIAVAL